ncbi:MAG: NAD(P)-dependent glycerol-3-phosphate dehydrogenase [Chromatiales bacterium]|nr:NAD(P)-dependent glycerol-3-phosphate dehydrogenase [Chromatiales bacterium]
MSTRPDDAVAVLGAGSWGTALAVQIARAGHPVTLWGRSAKQLALLSRERENRRYLPGVTLPPTLQVEPELAAAVGAQQDQLVCVPSHAFRATLERIAPLLPPDARVAWATKGFEQQTGALPHQVAREVLGQSVPLAVLSGPTFASEVGAGLPTAMTVAATDRMFATDFAARLSGETFRAYTSADLVGVEVGGAMKNVLAIGAGICDGLGFGANARIALITRGLQEMTRLGVALGARPATFTGLSGMGDLVLTSTDNQSRNRRLGLALAAGERLADAVAAIGQVVEGVYAAAAVHAVAARAGVELPICEQVYRILHEGLPPRTAVHHLMARTLKAETDLELWP